VSSILFKSNLNSPRHRFCGHKARDSITAEEISPWCCWSTCSISIHDPTLLHLPSLLLLVPAQDRISYAHDRNYILHLEFPGSHAFLQILVHYHYDATDKLLDWRAPGLQFNVSILRTIRLIDRTANESIRLTLLRVFRVLSLWTRRTSRSLRLR
jgi:hypothetical protein